MATSQQKATPQQNKLLKQMHNELHDLCQPLTALQCRLEMGRMLGTGEAFEEAVRGGLEETRRMFEAVARLRRTLANENDV